MNRPPFVHISSSVREAAFEAASSLPLDIRVKQALNADWCEWAPLSRMCRQLTTMEEALTLNQKEGS